MEEEGPSNTPACESGLRERTEPHGQGSWGVGAAQGPPALSVLLLVPGPDLRRRKAIQTGRASGSRWRGWGLDPAGCPPHDTPCPRHSVPTSPPAPQDQLFLSSLQRGGQRGCRSGRLSHSWSPAGTVFSPTRPGRRAAVVLEPGAASSEPPAPGRLCAGTEPDGKWAVWLWEALAFLNISVNGEKNGGLEREKGGKTEPTNPGTKARSCKRRRGNAPTGFLTTILRRKTGPAGQDHPVGPPLPGKNAAQLRRAQECPPPPWLSPAAGPWHRPRPGQTPYSQHKLPTFGTAWNSEPPSIKSPYLNSASSSTFQNRRA